MVCARAAVRGGRTNRNGTLHGVETVGGLLGSDAALSGTPSASASACAAALAYKTLNNKDILHTKH